MSKITILTQPAHHILIQSKGVQGVKGDKGDNIKGWSPMLANVRDGERRVLQVYDWQGGDGEKPPAGLYVGESGLTPDISLALDVRGPPGMGDGDMRESVYDPQLIEADAFDRANHTGSQSLDTISDAGSMAARDASDYTPTADLPEVARTGSYNDLDDKPDIPAAQVNSDWAATEGVARILNKPPIPAAQVNSDWTATSGVTEIRNKPALGTMSAEAASDYAKISAIPDLAANLGLIKTVSLTRFTASGTFTKASNDRFLIVEIIGGGGAAATSAPSGGGESSFGATVAAGGAGGSTAAQGMVAGGEAKSSVVAPQSGQHVMELIAASSLPASVTVVVGAGGGTGAATDGGRGEVRVWRFQS